MSECGLVIRSQWPIASLRPACWGHVAHGCCRTASCFVFEAFLVLSVDQRTVIENIFHHLSPQCVLMQRMQSWVEGVNDLLTQEVGGRLNRDQIDEAGFNFSFEIYRNAPQYILERKPRTSEATGSVTLDLWWLYHMEQWLNNSSRHQRANVSAWRQRLTLITWLEILSGSSW